MPYIEQEKRKELADFRTPMVAGELNYVISKIVDRYIFVKGISYTTLNEIIGALECAKLELYRRIVIRYEDVKLDSNGEVYTHGIDALYPIPPTSDQLELFPGAEKTTFIGEAKYGETKFG